MLSGQRAGNAVSFVKSYDPPGFGYSSVSYEGELNGDGTEIAGHWSIPRAGLSGEFLMIPRDERRPNVRAKRSPAGQSLYA
jgi:hypothetical protein